jgi:DNA-binding SARP family transcriptional activator
LPLTLPAALLVVLATHATWMARERLALILWPYAAPADALHHLRVNLHRAPSLLQGLGPGPGQSDALQAERTRVRLVLPSDLALLRAAQAGGDTTLLRSLSPAQWLQGWHLSGCDGFNQWRDDTAQQLQAQWLAACRGTPDAPLGRAAASSAAVAAPAPPGRDTQLRRLQTSAAPSLLLLGEPGAGKTTPWCRQWPRGRVR